MRTLVVGGGVAGLALASRLCQQGRPPVVVERSTASGDGYAISLYPMGSSVLHGLGSYPALQATSLEARRYLLADHRDRTMQAIDLSVLTDQAAPMLTVSRSDLLEVLESTAGAADIRRGVTVRSISQTPDAVVVDLDDGARETFDLVVGCDGMASPTRDAVMGRPGSYDSGWALWTWWDEAAGFDPEVMREWWGDDWFFGAYPAPGAVMCAAGAPAGSGRDDGDPGDQVRSRLAGLADQVPAVAAAVQRIERPYWWPMRDVRSPRWVERRVALCGDAAVGFLPTAGVGASCALRTAAGLADELSRADAATAPAALERYQRRCRSNVERSQTESRRLARAMFLSRPSLSWVRDQIVRRIPAALMLRQIIESSNQPL